MVRNYSGGMDIGRASEAHFWCEHRKSTVSRRGQKKSVPSWRVQSLVLTHCGSADAAGAC